MKVKKPQSKRKSTKLAKGIQKKVSAHNRKVKKQSKKDITWKSKHKKDPGIPNSFPFKGELLEQMEAERARELEERKARREQQRQLAVAQGATEEDLAQLEQEQDTVDNQNRLGALLQSARDAAAEYEGESDEDMEVDGEAGSSEEDDEAAEHDEELGAAFEAIQNDTSRKAFDKYFKQIIDACDVIIYVLDARNPDGTRSKQVEQTILANPHKRLIFALNKVDLVPTETLKKWIKHLQLSFPTVAIEAAGSAANAHTYSHPGLSRVSTANKLMESLKNYANASKLKRAVTVGVVGFPNVGKSSIINALLARHGSVGHRACPVGAQAGVTTEIRRVKIDNKLMILDSPGIVFPSAATKKTNPVDEQARLILLNAVPPKYLDDCRPAVTRLVKRLRKQPEQLDLFIRYYDLPALVSEPFDAYITGVLVHVARKLGRLGKGGVPDLGAAAQAVITDWRDGRLAGWAEAPAEPKTDAKQIEVVSGWSQEFDLDGILGSLMD